MFSFCFSWKFRELMVVQIHESEWSSLLILLVQLHMIDTNIFCKIFCDDHAMNSLHFHKLCKYVQLSLFLLNIYLYHHWLKHFLADSASGCIELVFAQLFENILACRHFMRPFIEANSLITSNSALSPWIYNNRAILEHLPTCEAKKNCPKWCAWFLNWLLMLFPDVLNSSSNYSCRNTNSLKQIYILWTPFLSCCNQTWFNEFNISKWLSLLG